MKNHAPEFHFSNNYWHCECTCRMRTSQVTRQEAEDWHLAHLKTVERARASLATKSDRISTGEYDWYQTKADDPSETASNRALWQMLADGIKPRLRSPQVADEPLFDMAPHPKAVNRKDQV